MINNLCEHIATILPELDFSIFIGDMPSLSDEGVSINLYDGDYNTEFFGMPKSIFRPLIRIFIRSKEYKKGLNTANIIKDTLHKRQDDLISSMLMQGYVMYLGKSEEKLNEFQLNFTVIVEESKEVI